MRKSAPSCSRTRATAREARLRTAFDNILRAVVREQPVATTIVVDVARNEAGGRRGACVMIAPKPDLHRALRAPRAPFNDRRAGVGLGLLDEHVRHCVRDAASASETAGDEKVDEALEAMARLLRT